MRPGDQEGVSVSCARSSHAGLMTFPHVNTQALPGAPLQVCHWIVSHTDQVKRSVEITSQHRVQTGAVQSSLPTLRPLKTSSACQVVMLSHRTVTVRTVFSATATQLSVRALTQGLPCAVGLGLYTVPVLGPVGPDSALYPEADRLIQRLYAFYQCKLICHECRTVTAKLTAVVSVSGSAPFLSE